MNLEKLIRKNIQRLQPYSCARDEYKGGKAIFLDANENPYENGYNRYPDPDQTEVKTAIASLKRVQVENILLGNGSDEVIDLLIRSVCEPRQDNIIVFSPGYSMYEVCAAINEVEVRKINLTPAFLPDWEAMSEKIDGHTKIIFLCTPNNPIGKVIPLEQIRQLCRSFEGLVLVDEAYIDFTSAPSAVGLLPEQNNVVIMQTLSKAWGMAGLRLGMCFAAPELIQVFSKVKAPYNISSLTQRVVLEELAGIDRFKQQCQMIIRERKRMLEELRALNVFRQVLDSEANFILGVSDVYRELYRYLVEQKIVVRLRDIPPVIPGGIRMTIGTKEENDRLLEALKCWKIQHLNI